MLEIDIGQNIDSTMSVSEAELFWLYNTAKEMQSIVEIGSYIGRSTFALCTSGCPSVTAVDNFKLCSINDFKKNVGHFGNLTTIPAPSHLAVEMVENADMIYIDACHEYTEVFRDLELWNKKATKLICGHDYVPGVTWTEVDKAVKTYFGKEPQLFETIWFFRK